ncbi:hypothetical protein ABZY44_13195 [Streptomyces sp. NPDC006544]|uniref:hypothetical protein n=1 Tax=Streptomyces sp. NPDC006544 TaxID=3154583 RepID=UPI0033B72DD3
MSDKQLIIEVPEGEWVELADLADATGQAVEEAVLEAVRAWVRGERARAGVEAGRLAGRHAALLRRLGE